MNRHFEIRLGDNEIKKILDDQKKGLPFIQIDGSNIHEYGFETEQISDYEPPDEFPKCCKYHEHFDTWSNKWFKKFPNCCKTHKALKKKEWFDKEKYKDVPSRIMQAISHTEFQIAYYIENDNWYKEITDYIEYCFQSFGSPTVGAQIYQSAVKHYIEKSTPQEIKFPKSKRNRLLAFFEVSEPTNKPPNLNILYSIFQKWLKSFPEILYFNNLRSRFKDKIPISLIIYEPEYNSYLGLSKMKPRTKGELLEILTNTTKKILRNIDSKKLIKDGVISDVNAHQLDLISGKHQMKQNSLLTKYSKKEAKYIKLIKQWLKNERMYFKEIVSLLESNESKYLEKLNQIHSETTTIKESIKGIETDFNDLVFILDRFTADQKIAINQILIQLNKTNNQLIEKDFENDEIKTKLSSIVASLDSSKLTIDEKTKIQSQINNPSSVSVKHKLKFTIPLILLKYEAELELGNKQKLPKNWKEWKKLLLKD